MNEEINSMKNKYFKNQIKNFTHEEKARRIENDNDKLRNSLEQKDSEIERIKCISLKKITT